MMKQRLYYFLGAIFTGIFALFLRKMWKFIPDFINFWIGDFLWAVMLYFFCRSIFYTFDQKKLTLGLIVFSCCVETSQLFHTPWLDAFRNTTFGGLLLGHGFLWSDILAYTFGIIAAYFLDKKWKIA
jgi:hypothetical protein